LLYIVYKTRQKVFKKSFKLVSTGCTKLFCGILSVNQSYIFELDSAQ